MSIAVRQMQSTDCVAALALACPDGVDLTPALMGQQLAALNDWPETLALVAEENGAVVGLCQARGVRLIASDGYVEVQILAVSPVGSGSNITTRLLDAITMWAFDLSYTRVRVRSGKGMVGVQSIPPHTKFVQSKAGYIFEYDIPHGNLPAPVFEANSSVECRMRVVTSAEARAISGILPSLGYPTAPDVVQARMIRLRTHPDNEVLVAERQGSIVGLCQIEGANALIAGRFAEIHALAVASDQQRRGIGAALLRHALYWACRHGYANVRLGSGAHREAAHAFYVRQGFTQSAISYAFERHATC